MKEQKENEIIQESQKALKEQKEKEKQNSNDKKNNTSKNDINNKTNKEKEKENINTIKIEKIIPKKEPEINIIKNNIENNNKKELKNEEKEISEEISKSSSLSLSEKSKKNYRIKKYKNFDFYQIVKYLKRFADYLDKNNTYFTIEDKKNFINLMEYLNSKEMNDTIQFLKMTNIGNYINYINEKTSIKEFKDLTQKFLDVNKQKIQLQLFVENTLDMTEFNI